MNFKKLAAVGVLALVVVGCVLAAGCTSTEDTTKSIMDSIESELGNALAEYDFEDILSDLEENTTTDSESGEVVLFSAEAETVNGVTTGTYTINGETTNVVYTADDIAGTWVQKVDVGSGIGYTIKLLLNKDGTGTRISYDLAGNVDQQVPLTWESNGVGFDIAFTFDGDDCENSFLFSADKKSIIEHSGDLTFLGYTKE